MELTKNIFFNTDKLIQNTTVKISYIGKLFIENSDEVYIHYGFGDSWDELNDKKMNKTELGFQVEIPLNNKNSFNFCFRDNNNNWDNNNSADYIFPIESTETSLIVQNNNTLGLHKNLRKSYLISKKIKITLYKIATFLPRLISSRKRILEQ